MAVLVKGMKMPVGADELRLIIRSNGQVIVSHKTYYEDTEAVELPQHGRLIDADALTDCLATLLQFPSNLVNGQWIVNTLREQPTIIPAEESA